MNEDEIDVKRILELRAQNLLYVSEDDFNSDMSIDEIESKFFEMVARAKKSLEESK